MNNTAKKELNDRRDILNPLRLDSSAKVIDDSKTQKCWLGRVCMLLKDVVLSLLNVCKLPVCFLAILAGSTGASRGNDKTDFVRNVPSGTVFIQCIF